MNLAFPAALAFAGLTVPLVLLYFLKLRRRRRRVPANWLFAQVLQDHRAQAPWERLRRHLLLLLQLLALLLFVLAAAGPFLEQPSRLGERTVVVLDGSASMTARASGPSRFARAQSRVRELLREVDGNHRVALILAGPQPRLVTPLSSDRGQLTAALGTVAAAKAPADLDAALALAAGLVADSEDGEVVLVTDGCVDAVTATSGRLDATRIVTIDEVEDETNVGIVAAALRRSSDGSSSEVFATVAASGADRRVTLVLERRSDDGAVTELDRDSFHVAAGSERSRLLVGPPTPGLELQLRLVDTDDALPADDVVDLLVPPSPRRRVLLVSPRPQLLQRALRAVPEIELMVVDSLPDPVPSADLFVFDGVEPTVMPEGPGLVFGAGRGDSRVPALQAIERVQSPRLVRIKERHPLLRHVDLRPVSFSSARVLALPPGTTGLLETASGAIATVTPTADGPLVVFGFDLTETDLPLRVAFPVLVHDAVTWLVGRDDEQAVFPTGTDLDLRVTTAGEWTHQVGDAAPTALTSSGLQVRLPAGQELGRHALRGPGSATRDFTVALLSPFESDLAGRLNTTDEPVPSTVTSGDADANEARRPGRLFLWLPLVLLALVVLGAEWVLHHRGEG
ncbi:MAG: VWA domain-containing protein [Acidobacteriota bacterium]